MTRIQKYIRPALLALAVVPLLGVAAGHVDEDGGWDPREARAALFRPNEGHAARPSHRETAGTLAKWSRSNHDWLDRAAKRWSRGDSPAAPGAGRGVRVTLASHRRVFSAIVITDPEAGETEVTGCSGVTSVKKPGDPPMAGGCSTSGLGVPVPSGHCSANVPNPGSTGGDNTACSISNSGVGQADFCSTVSGNGNTTTTCSTSGGQSPGGTNGAAACSAGNGEGPGANPGGTDVCSVNSAGGTSCSTAAGEHQACSAGNTGMGNQTALCSTLDGAGAGATCSVGNSAPAGKFGNKCSSINTQPSNGRSACSALAANTTCSVKKGQEANGACTAMNIEGGSVPKGSPQFCSAHSGKANAKCSVIDNSGGAVRDNPICGKVSTHDGHVIGQ